MKIFLFLIVFLCFIVTLTSCASKQLKSASKSCMIELNEAKKRINELENDINDLKTILLEVDEKSKKYISDVEDKYNQLLESLQKEIINDKIEITMYKGILTINIAEQLFFDSGKAELKKEGIGLLARLGNVLKTIDDKVIRVEGHTDNVSISKSYQHKFPTNWELGSSRAVNVVRYFTEKIGIDPTRISAISFGEHRPVSSNKTEEGRSKNRRIEIVLLDKMLYQILESKGINN